MPRAVADGNRQSPMRFQTLDQWLRWLESLNPARIELGLERVRAVWERLHSGAPPFTVLTVAGTNGKGSCVAMLEAMLQAGGYRVGAYTSPHLLRYTERIRVQGQEVDEATLCAAFEQVESARGDVPLTYFEFGTLAAFLVFMEADLDAVVLEVGLGGRLDAVNVLDPDVALVASVGIDHVDWLGPDRESIGREKAGIFRAARPAVYAEPDIPDSVAAYAAELGAPLYVAGRDFQVEPAPGGWHWRGPDGSRHGLPHPALRGAIQLQNAAACLMALDRLSDRLPLSQDAVRAGLQQASLPGRFQVVRGDVDCILDVAHNPQGVEVLAANLRSLNVPGRVLAVWGMLETKDAAGVAARLGSVVNAWYLASLERESHRGLSAERLAEALGKALPDARPALFDDVCAAVRQARADARSGDCILVFGSFHTVAAALRDCV